MSISIGSLASALPGATSPVANSAGAGFGDVIAAAINQVETAQHTASSAAAALLVQGQGDIHTVALAAQKASLSLEMFQQVRNKFVSAYQEIMRMPM